MRTWTAFATMALLMSGCASPPAPGPADDSPPDVPAEPGVGWTNGTGTYKITAPLLPGFGINDITYGRNTCLRLEPQGEGMRSPAGAVKAKFVVSWTPQSPLVEELYVRALVYRDIHTQDNVSTLPAPDTLAGATGPSPLTLEVPAFGIGPKDSVVLASSPPESNHRLAAYEQEVELEYAVPYAHPGDAPVAAIHACFEGFFVG